MKKKKHPKTIGEMTGSRGTWQMNPVTKIVPDKKKYSRKQKHKNGGMSNE